MEEKWDKKKVCDLLATISSRASLGLSVPYGKRCRMHWRESGWGDRVGNV